MKRLLVIYHKDEEKATNSLRGDACESPLSCFISASSLAIKAFGASPMLPNDDEDEDDDDDAHRILIRGYITFTVRLHSAVEKGRLGSLIVGECGRTNEWIDYNMGGWNVILPCGATARQEHY